MYVEKFKAYPLHTFLMVINLICGLLDFTLGGWMVTTSYDYLTASSVTPYLLSKGDPGQSDITSAKAIYQNLIILGILSIIEGILFFIHAQDLFFLIGKMGKDKPVLKPYTRHLEKESAETAVHSSNVKHRHRETMSQAKV